MHNNADHRSLYEVANNIKDINTLLVPRTALAAPTQSGWCDGCSPDNCVGCATPAAPVDADVQQDAERLDFLIEQRPVDLRRLLAALRSPERGDVGAVQ